MQSDVTFSQAVEVSVVCVCGALFHLFYFLAIPRDETWKARLIAPSIAFIGFILSTLSFGTWLVISLCLGAPSIIPYMFWKVIMEVSFALVEVSFLQCVSADYPDHLDHLSVRHVNEKFYRTEYCQLCDASRGRMVRHRSLALVCRAIGGDLGIPGHGTRLLVRHCLYSYLPRIRSSGPGRAEIVLPCRGTRRGYGRMFDNGSLFTHFATATISLQRAMRSYLLAVDTSLLDKGVEKCATASKGKYNAD